MLARITTFSFIVCFLLAGILLTITPWIEINQSDWGDNFLLAFLSSKSGLPVLREAVSSGWVRGAVTGLGVVNLFIAFWELANFNRTVSEFEGKPPMEK